MSTRDEHDLTRKRGNTVQMPAGTRYSLWTWTKGYAALVALTPLYLVLWFLARVVKRLPELLRRKLLLHHQRHTVTRNYDVRIPTNPTIPAYMLRWWRITRNAYFNCYYHVVMRSDDDTALHDHPWWSFSVVLDGGYWEHSILPGGVHRKMWYGPGSMQFRRSGAVAHRLELPSHEVPVLEDHRAAADYFRVTMREKEQPARTIFITGPVLRRWGFHHPEQWVDAYEWDEFCQARGIGSEKMAGYAEQLTKK